MPPYTLNMEHAERSYLIPSISLLGSAGGGCQGHQPESSLLGVAHILEKTHAQWYGGVGTEWTNPPPPPAHCNYKLQTIHKDQQRDMESEQRDMQAEGH